MNARKFSIVTAVAVTLIAPALSMADTPWVPDNTDRGFSYQPDHGSTAAGAQGRSAGTAVAPGALLREGTSQDTAPSAATGKTREQVRNEYLNMSAAEKQRLRELNRN